MPVPRRIEIAAGERGRDRAGAPGPGLHECTGPDDAAAARLLEYEGIQRPVRHPSISNPAPRGRARHGISGREDVLG